MEVLRDNYLTYKMDMDYLHVNVASPKFPLGTFYEETIKQVKYVYENKTKPLYIFLSGGLDSEYLLHVCHELKLDFQTVIIRQTGENGSVIYNDFDIKYAYKICNKLNIKPLIYDFDFDQYVESGEIFTDMGEDCFPKLIYPWVFTKVAKDLNGCSLLSGEFHGIQLDKVSNRFCFPFGRGTMYFLDLFKNNNIEGSPCFLSYSCEMLFSFLLDPEIKKLITGGYPGKESHDSTKAFVYNRGNNFNLEGYDYVKRNRIKLNGYEKLSNYKILNHPNYVKIQSVYKKDKHPVFDYREDIFHFLKNHNIKL